MGTKHSSDLPASVEPAALLVEEPLEIRLGGQTIATTMRTPGHDFELAVGFCRGDGYLAMAKVRSVRYEDAGADGSSNVVVVDTDGPQPEIAPRLGTVSSSCGICGTDQLEELAASLTPLAVSAEPPDDSIVLGLGAAVAEHQQLFKETGGSHAAADFDLATGTLGVVREDIGRHNAVDKVVGNLVLTAEAAMPQAGGRMIPATERGLWVSGRASFEMVQKAWAGGFSLLVSVSAPSTLAVEAANRANLGLIAFSRSDRFTVYNQPSSWSPE